MYAPPSYSTSRPANGQVQTNAPVGTTSYGRRSQHSSLYSTQRPQVDILRAVTTLLETTKQLQEMLRLWSIQQATESQVSDVYVRVGTEFNATVTAFAVYSIDMT